MIGKVASIDHARPSPHVTPRFHDCIFYKFGDSAGECPDCREGKILASNAKKGMERLIGVVLALHAVANLGSDLW